MSIKFRNEVTMRPIETVMPYYRNAKLHDEEQIKKIAAQIATVGWDQPIVVDTQGIIIKGHGRLAAAKSLGLTEVPVIVSDISEKEARLARIADNKVAESGWDNDMLAQELADLKALGESLDLSAFETKEVDEVLNEYDRKTNPRNESEDEVPEVKETTVKLGDLYQLGNHRLLCGDATKKEDVERLMGGEKADMVFTDPPYGMNLDTDYSSMVQKHGGKGQVFRRVHGDSTPFDPSHLLELCDEMFLFGADYYAKKLPEGGSWIVWDKRESERTGSQMGASMYGSAFELCWSKKNHKRMIARILWAGGVGEGISEDRRGRNNQLVRSHPTQKPISLAEWFFEQWGKDKTNIVDLYLGSGSTLIACEKTNRKCMGCEIDPLYCAVIIERWEKFTGKKATLIENLQTLEMTSDGSEVLLETPLDPALFT